ncbi:anaerobic ribonucleoside-triphosphate reductase activating protein [Anoxybacter fermentans]|uniref:Anaerobic ribonucleoside-triphosphate reductase activating protein n=1 Tax=Anoxybacter fermentans TaxID=1323375 RepID=A0A3S9SX39_9FIRM|nr:anaerobic ribonucleoside-triphosphate reductase activating protein [Anoxybacter fermentans]AZR72820.1 anaerobic ribonucleoside-triphosphate reductase activating protein [Anoxybacter fermentans]
MLPIVGWQKTSLIDYPKKISSIFFTPGCNFRCPYCHNPQLVTDTVDLETIPEDIIWAHLKKRRKVLDGVVITGGEPTLHGEKLIEFIFKIKKMGYLVKLDTNGSQPELLKRLIEDNLIDYIAMDLKTSIPEYTIFTRTDVDLNKIKESIEFLIQSANSKLVDVEFRTTLHPRLHNEKIFHQMVELIKDAPRYVLQTFRSNITLDPEYLRTQPFTEHKMIEFLNIAKKYVKECLIR